MTKKEKRKREKMKCTFVKDSQMKKKHVEIGRWVKKNYYYAAVLSDFRIKFNR